MDYGIMVKTVSYDSTNFFQPPRSSLGVQNIVSLPGPDTVVNKFIVCTVCETIIYPMASMCKKGHPICDRCFQNEDLACCIYVDENGKGCGSIYLCNLPMGLYEYIHQNSTFKCPNRAVGCTENVLGGNLNQHVRSLCEFRDLKRCFLTNPANSLHKCVFMDPALSDYYEHLLYDHEVANTIESVGDFVVQYDDPKYKKGNTCPFMLSCFEAQFMVIIHPVDNRIAMWMAAIRKPPGSRFKATFMIVHNEKFLSKPHNSNKNLKYVFHETHSVNTPFTEIIDLGECFNVTRSVIESNFLMEDENGTGRIWCIGVLIEAI